MTRLVDDDYVRNPTIWNIVLNRQGIACILFKKPRNIPGFYIENFAHVFGHPPKLLLTTVGTPGVRSIFKTLPDLPDALKVAKYFKPVDFVVTTGKLIFI